MTFLNSFMICNSMVNLGREFKHLIKVGRFVHFNLKHSTTQFGTQNKPNSPEFKCFNKFQVFILLVIYLCSRQIENLEICVHKIFMEIKQKYILQRENHLYFHICYHKMLLHFVVRIVSFKSISHAIYFVLDVTYTC